MYGLIQYKDMKKILLTGLLVIVLLGAGMLIKTERAGAPDKTLPANSGANDINPSIPINPGVRLMSIEDYIKQNIRELSKEKEVLGGTFYVTKIDVNDNSGTVYYEDGHNAFVADFTYTMDEREGIKIPTFVIRK
jgi:hypothetical protein